MAPLQNWQLAVIDPGKLSAYALNPDHSDNHEKWQAFAAVGYVVLTSSQRERAASDIAPAILENLSNSEAIFQGETRWGRRYGVRIRLTGPNGSVATAVTVWQYDYDNSAPRLLTLWLQVHTDGESR